LARNWHKAAPLLKKYGFPSTLYVTTRDVLSEAPVFDVELRYLLWKKRNETLDLCSIGLDPETIVLSTTDERESGVCRISEISKNWDDHNKQVMLLKLAETLGIDLNSDGDSPPFSPDDNGATGEASLVGDGFATTYTLSLSTYW